MTTILHLLPHFSHFPTIPYLAGQSTEPMAARRKYHSDPVQGLLPMRPPTRVLLLYALGQLGWSLASYGVSNLLIYFYMPPEQGTPIFPTFIFQGAILGVLTIIGVLSAFGRLFDAFVDPLIAFWSDLRDSRMGKRRWFMLVGAAPFALFSFLAFYPPEASESGSNMAWLALIILLYYFFFAFYVIPYTALIAELGHDPKDRMRISTLISIAWALGFIAGNSAYALQSYFEGRGFSSVAAFQTAMFILSGFALFCMLMPALFLDEPRYARQSKTEHRIWSALRHVFGNRNFRFFLLSDLMYWLALNFIQLGIGFYTTLLLGLDKSYAFGFSLISFISSFAFYWPVNVLTRILGKKRLMLMGFVIFSGLFFILAFVRILPLPPEWILYGMGIIAAFPLAVFGILPNALIADVVDAEERAHGHQMSGMFYGIRAFTMKIGISLANLIFPSLLLFGKSADNPYGVQLTAFAAVIFCLAGWQVFRKYEEV